MSAGKPTPGPWAVSDDAGQAVVSLGDVPVRDIVVATLPRIHHANARLVAASPKMLEGLKLAVARLARVDGGDSMVVSTLLDLIFGATGESFDVEAYIADEDDQARGCP